MWLFRSSPYASVCVGKYLESELSDIPRHPHPRLPGGRLKSRKYKKSAVGGKKSPATPVQKEDYLIIYRWHHINGITQAIVFLPPTADFLNGHRPLFEPYRLLSSCKAWRWGVAATTRRKTRFPTGVTANPQKAKPTTSAMAFCIYINLLQKEQIMD